MDWKNMINTSTACHHKNPILKIVYTFQNAQIKESKNLTNQEQEVNTCKNNQLAT